MGTTPTLWVEDEAQHCCASHSDVSCLRVWRPTLFLSFTKPRAFTRRCHMPFDIARARSPRHCTAIGVAWTAASIWVSYPSKAPYASDRKHRSPQSSSLPENPDNFVSTRVSTIGSSAVIVPECTHPTSRCSTRAAQRDTVHVRVCTHACAEVSFHMLPGKLVRCCLPRLPRPASVTAPDGTTARLSSLTFSQDWN